VARVDRPTWVPSEVDLTRPSAARVYDYYLGGSHNLDVDRRMAREAISMWPDLPVIMQSNRAFLRRAVRYLSGQGITQFLDIGSGIPTVGNVHEVAQHSSPQARVAYVDRDPVAVAHSRAILAGDDRTVVVHADLRDGDRILDEPSVQATIDVERPVAVLMVAVLHFVPDEDDPAGAVARLRDRLAPGSHLVVSHASAEGRPEVAGAHRELYRRTATPMTMRTPAEIARFFDGFDLVDPGLVWLPLWRPDEPATGQSRPERTTGLAGVGRKA
jgi:SAM-dependent methyltransferase